MMSKGPGGRWTCNECGKDFRDKTDTRRHIEAKHTNHAFPCNICGMKLASRDSLRRHFRRLHAPAGEQGLLEPSVSLGDGVAAAYAAEDVGPSSALQAAQSVQAQAIHGGQS